MDNIILLDLDGVLIISKPWLPDVLLNDGFAQFNDKSVERLNKIIEDTKYRIILSSNRRYSISIDEMNTFFKTRGVISEIIDYLPLYDLDLRLKRCDEIKMFIEKHNPINYLIIDDDKSIAKLNSDKWIKTDPMIGLL